ncbi:MAG: hypothetical protein HQK53_18440 [Oligoflexia bacterium]|nr:hypothetical protein [Oligoflexia bacterium]
MAAILNKGVGTRIAGHYVGSTIELDLSKSFLNGYIDLQKRPIPVEYSLEHFDLQDEFLFYIRQLSQSFSPKYFLIEVDAYPLTNLGLHVYQNKQRTFHDWEFAITSHQIGLKRTRINVLELITTRYETPYSFSFFLGEILTLVSPKNEGPSTKGAPAQTGNAIMGHVITFGDRRLMKMEELHDKWLHYSYKIKGEDNNPTLPKKWGLQLGYLHHQNTRFFNGVTFNVVRDWTAPAFISSWLANLKLDYQFLVPLNRISGTRGLQKYTSFQKILLGRNINFQSFILGLEFGIKWECFKIGGEVVFSETSVILAPNISW